LCALFKLGSAPPASPANPQTNASAQRHRGVGQGAENSLAAMQAASEVTLN